MNFFANHTNSSLKFILKKDFENKMGVGFEKLKASPCAFVKTILKKERFQQTWKDIVDKYLYYHIPFKDWCWKLHISFVCFQKNSCASPLNNEIDSSLFYHNPLKELIRKSEVSLTLSWKNSCALFLKHEFGATLYHLRFKELLEKRFSRRNVENPGFLKTLRLLFLIVIL
ncbi:hypothetical protein M9H77_02509 [Catharanthus roseus]|uniref:Uncharacterized protein n=1 Tax=Catharanthus roseus TaxID=4058 RepID=A0ACC0C8W5_CATRO|nr:hypothetical protein M9H77_02509 [Catharanthus roseus]